MRIAPIVKNNEVLTEERMATIFAFAQQSMLERYKIDYPDGPPDDSVWIGREFVGFKTQSDEAFLIALLGTPVLGRTLGAVEQAIEEISGDCIKSVPAEPGYQGVWFISSGDYEWAVARERIVG